MRLGELYKESAEKLRISGAEDFDFDARVLISHFLDIPFSNIFTASGYEVSPSEEFFKALEKRALRYPLQYIIGQWDFMSLELYVGEGVLIPRNDTEVLVRVISENIKNGAEGFDLCAGTGAVGLGICSLNPTVSVTMAELYEGAFAYLKKNAEEYSIYNTRCLKADIFDPKFCSTVKDGSLDFIASNPPYIADDEYRGLEPEIFKEPETALVAEEQGLYFYRRIAEMWTSKLKNGGILAVEIGDSQGKAVSDIFESTGFKNVKITKDLSGLDRCVSGFHKK